MYSRVQDLRLVRPQTEAFRERERERGRGREREREINPTMVIEVNECVFVRYEVTKGQFG